MSKPTDYDAVLFDLLTALVDSWSLWDDLAGDVGLGRRWRMSYLEMTYATEKYRPYLDLVAESAKASGLPKSKAAEMDERWDELEPWPEAPGVVSDLASQCTVAVVTNCSEELGRRAAAIVSPHFEVVLSAERAGYYKPNSKIYGGALGALGLPAERVLYVAGSPFDVCGASAMGMPVYWHNRIGLVHDEAASLALDVQADLGGLRNLVT